MRSKYIIDKQTDRKSVGVVVGVGVFFLSVKFTNFLLAIQP